MMGAQLHEDVVEQATLSWLESLSWGVIHGPDTGPQSPNAERDGYTSVALEQRLRDALANLNPCLTVDALGRCLSEADAP